MTIEDKTFLLGICQMPRLGLSAEQVGEIERILDGREARVDVVAVTYSQAAALLGFTSANSAKTIEKYVREGRLVKAAPGRVTMESVRALGRAA